MTAYYNEFDPFAVQWLRELIKEGVIADGIVDDRSILEVDAKDLEGFNQHHFFAGIGGWSYALRLAGWSDSRPVCTASLPCQPFSVAGQNLGKDDERHLLPHFMQLVRDYGKFDTIMGEQVEGAVRHGWLDDLQTNMEAEGYSTGAVVLGAHSVYAPHQRQRLYWVADSINKGSQGRLHRRQDSQREVINGHAGRSGSDSSTVAKSDSSNRRPIQEPGQQARSQWWQPDGNGCCNDMRLIWCRDGKYRPISVEPALFPLLDGVPNRVGILRGAGNAIVPQVAAEVIRAFMEGEE